MTNQLLNPGFETGTPGSPDNWYTFSNGGTPTFTYPAPGRTGGSSVEVSKGIADGFEAVWGQNLTAGLGIIYILQGWMKTSITPSVSGGGKIAVDWFDAGNVYITTTDVIPFPWISGTTDWTFYSNYLISPINAVIGHVLLGVDNCVGSAFYDDMFFDAAGFPVGQGLKI